MPMYFCSVGRFSSIRFAVMPSWQPNSIITRGATLAISAYRIEVSCELRYLLNAPCSGTTPSSARVNLRKRARPIVRLGLPAQSDVLVPWRDPAPTRPMRQQSNHARMPDRAGQVQRRGVNADDLVHAQHQRRAILEALELVQMHAKPARFVAILDLHAVNLDIAQRADQLENRNLARIVAIARLADRPRDADTLAVFHP